MSTINDVTVGDTATKTQNPNDYSDLLQTPHSDAFAFSETEELALELYDQLRELEMQRALIEAQDEVHVPHVSALSDAAVEAQLSTAQREAMEAKARFEIRNSISHNVLVMDPVLKAVHGGEDTDVAEKRLLPLITENDTVSMLQGSLASRLASSTLALSGVERENIAANRKNSKLSKTLLKLAEEMKAQSTEDIEDPRLRGQVQAVEKELKESRRRMKTVKGVLSAMVVGSGINWAADAGLREMVMDDSDED